MKSIVNYLAHGAFVLFITATAVPLVLSGGGVYPMTCALSIILTLLCTGFRSLRSINGAQFSFFIVCCVYFLVTSLFIETFIGEETLKEYFLFYLIAGLGSLLIVNYSFSYIIFLKILIVFALVIAPIVITTNYSKLLYEADNDEWMSKIYAITPFIIGSIHYLFVGESKIFKFLSVLSLILYSSMFIMHTPRGAVVMVVASLMVFILQKMLDKGWGFRELFTIGFIFFIFIVITAEFLIKILQDIAEEYHLAWLVKFVLDEDISNNRNPLFKEAIDGFISSPVWGNGIATFHNFWTYPHNLFLQMLYETGILMIIPISYLLLKVIKIILNRKSMGGIDYRFFTYFFLLSMNQLMFSSFFWRNHCFWLMIWSIMGVLYKKSRMKSIYI